MKRKAPGFTLVELSIVLVIIGMIVGGVVGGQSLIQSAKINSIYTDIQKIRTGIRAFELQYDSLPGDFPEAYAYFDGGSGSAICGANNDPNSAAGCNGDGDNNIEHSNSPISREVSHVFQHLGLAKIIGGSYSNNQDSADTYYSSPINNALFHVEGTNSIRFSTLAPDGYTSNGVLTTAQAKQIDKKFDDGLANSGSILGRRSGNGGNLLQCLASTPPYEYVLSQTAISCRLIFNIK